MDLDTFTRKSYKLFNFAVKHSNDMFKELDLKEIVELTQKNSAEVVSQYKWNETEFTYGDFLDIKLNWGLFAGLCEDELVLQIHDISLGSFKGEEINNLYNSIAKDLLKSQNKEKHKKYHNICDILNRYQISMPGNMPSKYK